MKPSDKQLAAGTLAFNSHKSVVIPDCISSAYDAMTEAMTVEEVRAWAKGKGLAVVPLEPTEKVKAAYWGWVRSNTWQNPTEIYKAMIKAAEEE